MHLISKGKNKYTKKYREEDDEKRVIAHAKRS